MTSSAPVAAPAPASTPRRSPGWLIWAALATVYVVWGSTYLGIRVVVETMPPLLSMGARFLVAGLVMLAIVAARSGRAALRIDRRRLLWVGFCGCALVTGGNGLVAVAEQSIASGLAALIIAAVPMWVVVMRRLTGQRIARVTIAGVVAGFGGVALLLLPGGGGHAEPLGFALVVAGSLCWATGSFVSSRVPLPPDPFLSTALQMIAGGLLSALIGLAAGEGGRVDADAFALDSVIAWAYLVVFGSLVAFTAYVWLLQNAPISKVATYAFVNPVIAILLGWLVLSEDITLTIAAGAVVIVCSVAAIVRQESR